MAPLPANDSEESKIADLLSLVARLGTQVGALFLSPSGDLGTGLVWDILSIHKTFSSDGLNLSQNYKGSPVLKSGPFKWALLK